LIDGAFIPGDAEPLQIFDGLFICAGFDARAVEIFDSQDDFPAALAGHQPVEQESSRVAQVQCSCGGWREARCGH